MISANLTGFSFLRISFCPIFFLQFFFSYFSERAFITAPYDVSAIGPLIEATP